MHSRLAHLSSPSLLRDAAFIGGEWSRGIATFSVQDPATGEPVGEVPDLTAEDAGRAIEVAATALPSWRARSAGDRARILRRWYDLILQHRDDLAAILTAEQGKPLAEARGEVAYGASFIEWFGEQARRIDGDIIPAPSADRRIFALKQPVGVCAAITPWNFPIAMVTRKLAPALAAGCTMVLKPAEQTPLSALAIAELAHQAGLPEGVLNIVTASAAHVEEIGAALCADTRVRHLSFTGSTEVGRILMQQCAANVKRLSLELGGHAPFIVFEDADIDAAVEGAIASKFRNAGQTCVCANRFYVHEAVAAAFVEKLTDRTRALRVGNGFDDGVEVGPLIDDAAVAKVRRHVDDAVAQGARVLCGGQAHGRVFQPTVVAGVTPWMLVSREETFGPVAPVSVFRRDDEALALANASEFGLAAYFYGRDIGRVWRIAEALEYGMVGVNTGIISHEMAPFGGVKQSGFGREGSKYGIEEYLDIKYVCMAGL